MAIKILSWNVNGYRAILKKVDTAFPGYRSQWNCAERKGYSGVASLFREEPLSVSSGLDIRRFDSEGRVITLEYFFINEEKKTSLRSNRVFFIARLDFPGRFQIRGE